MERTTRQRQAIRAAIEGADRPLSVQEVLVSAHADVPGLGVATVYRNLKLLVEEGDVKVVTLPGEDPHYELSDLRHHHHFQCETCRRVFDVHACPPDLGMQLPSGFTLKRHEITLYGACRDCRRDTAAKKRPKPNSVQRRAVRAPR